MTLCPGKECPDVAERLYLLLVKIIQQHVILMESFVGQASAVFVHICINVN